MFVLIINRAKSFMHAGHGIWVFIKMTPNAWIQIFIAIIVIIFGFYFKISRIEWMIMIISIGFVLTAEAFNSAVEVHIDSTSPEYSLNTRDMKDIAAGAVLISATASFFVGLLIFVPYIL